ncbi:hypothetical protein NM74_04855 [Aeromonas hydrophila]|nr:hypothetical protein NM74_04855 [Aeromonas hydrophila]
MLPGGIYPVEVRIVQGGREVARLRDMIYKPTKWRNFERKFNYDIFAGTMVQNNYTASSKNRDDGRGQPAFGVEGEYLVRPYLQLGVMAKQVASQSTFGGSLDYTFAEWITFYATYSLDSDQNNALNTQLRFDHGVGSMTLGYTRNENNSENARNVTSNASLSWDKSVANGVFATVMMGYNRVSDKYSYWSPRSYSGSPYGYSGNEEKKEVKQYGYNRGGFSVDAGLTVISDLFGNNVTWRVSGFDRPDIDSSRDSGLQLAMNISAVKDKRSYDVSINSNNGTAGRLGDYSVTVGGAQQIDHEYIKNLALSATGDKGGLGLSASTTFSSPLLGGTSFIQRTTNSKISTGLNVNNSIVLGSGGGAISGDHQYGDAVVVVDVESDIPGAEFRVEDSLGGDRALKLGRNIVSTRAFTEGTQQYYLSGKDAPGALITPPIRHYHLNKGSVDYQKVEITSTISIMGRVLAADGSPLAGANVLNHGSRSVSESDGFFSMEVSKRVPTLNIEYKKAQACSFDIDINKYRLEGDVLFVGDLRCLPTMAHADINTPRHPKSQG